MKPQNGPGIQTMFGAKKGLIRFKVDLIEVPLSSHSQSILGLTGMGSSVMLGTKILSKKRDLVPEVTGRKGMHSSSVIE